MNLTQLSACLIVIATACGAAQAQSTSMAEPAAAASAASASNASIKPVAAAPSASLAAPATATTPPLSAASAAGGLPPSQARSAAPVFKNDVYGVEVMGAHISSAGYVIDVRYKVLDAAKAAPMLDRKVRPVLINEVNNERFYVPQPPVVGALRQTSRNNNIVPGKVYFMLFANPDKRIKNGDKLTLFVGDQKFGVLEVGR
jgi:hypothetical protein